jgi:hypothetical protein
MKKPREKESIATREKKFKKASTLSFLMKHFKNKICQTREF